MLQLLPSFACLSLDSLSRRRAAPTGAGADEDADDDTDAEEASKLLMMMSQGSAPGPSQPGSSQPASLTEAQMKERKNRLSDDPRAVAARMRRKAQSEAQRAKEEMGGNRQPTARKKNPNLGNNVPWVGWDTHRLWGLLQDEKKRTNGEGPIDYNAVHERFNDRLLDGEKRSLDQIKGKIRMWEKKAPAGDRPNPNKVRKQEWTEEEERRLREIDQAVPERADGKKNLNEIVRRYNQGLPEADHRGKESLGRKLGHLNKPRVPAYART